MAAGVPYVARPPVGERAGAPLIVAWHLMAPPRSEAAMAAALPLNTVPAWRVYFGLPLYGTRAPAGGADEIARRMMKDYVLDLFGPVVAQAAAEARDAIEAVREQLQVGSGPVGLLGGSAGGAVALQVLLEAKFSASALALVNPAVQLASIVALGERSYGLTYPWTEASRTLAKRFDFVERAPEIGRRNPQPAMLLVSGADDAAEIREPMQKLAESLVRTYKQPGRVSLVSIPDMSHAIAEEPGTDPAPQTAAAKQTDAAISDWFRRYL